MSYFQENAISFLRALKCLSLLPLTIILLLTFFSSGFSAELSPWYVRLIVSSDDGRIDRGNVLGRLVDGKLGQDSHDLPEMAPPPSPMGDRYLSIVFPHPEWETEMKDYSSDYRPLSTDPAASDIWKFEVRTHTPGIKAKLSWEGDQAILERSRLKNGKDGAVLVENCAKVSSHSIDLHGKRTTFIWEYQGLPGEAVEKEKK